VHFISTAKGLAGN